MEMGELNITKIITTLENFVEHFEEPAVSKVARNKRDPYRILISTILSLRTKDKTTLEASERLFSKADTPHKMLKLTQKEIESLIYPVGFYRRKSGEILEISKRLIEKYKGKVPDSMKELLKLNGVGRKTANLVINEGFNKPGICVDTHVHRISNRLGLVETKTPEQSETELMKIVPKKYWIKYNSILVPFGQNVCRPISPLCSECPVEKQCSKVNVKRHR
jgi:endonuclease-3